MFFRKMLKALFPERYHPYWKLRRVIETATNGVVLSGPFQGLSLPPKATFDAYSPKILGTCELELHAIVKEIIRSDFAAVSHIGAAEGYCACGFAAAIPEVQVTAFEAAVSGRYLQQPCDLPDARQTLCAGKIPAAVQRKILATLRRLSAKFLWPDVVLAHRKD